LTKSHGHTNTTNSGGAYGRSQETCCATMMASHWNHSMQAMLTQPCLGSTRTSPVPSLAVKQLASSPHRMLSAWIPQNCGAVPMQRGTAGPWSANKQHGNLVSAAATNSTAGTATFGSCTWFLSCEESYASSSTLCSRSLLFPFVDKLGRHHLESSVHICCILG